MRFLNTRTTCTYQKLYYLKYKISIKLFYINIRIPLYIACPKLSLNNKIGYNSRSFNVIIGNRYLVYRFILHKKRKKMLHTVFTTNYNLIKWSVIEIGLHNDKVVRDFFQILKNQNYLKVLNVPLIDFSVKCCVVCKFLSNVITKWLRLV